MKNLSRSITANILSLAVVASVALGSSSGRAVPVTITMENDNQDIDNVLFNDGSLSHSGSLVQGNFNGSGAGFIIDFTSFSGTHQLVSNGGQARIEGGVGNTPYRSLTFGLESGATFTKAVLNANASADGQIDFMVSYIDANFSPFEAFFAMDGNGENYFIRASEGARITQVTFSTSTLPETVGFSDTRQIRLGGFAAADNNSQNVPDGGATSLLLGFAVVAIGALKKRFGR